VRLSLALLLLALHPLPGTCQQMSWARRWGLAVGGDGTRFGAIARDATAPAESATDLRPSPRTGLRIGVTRGLGAWRVQLEAGWAQGEAEAGDETLVVRDKTLDLSRYRLAPGVETRVAGIGSGELAVALAPTLDLWRASGSSRLRLGVEGRCTLRVALGEVALENRLTVGLSQSPLDPEDLGDGFDTKRLRWLAFGVGVWLPL